MNHIDVFNQIAHDLNIIKYEGESDYLFHSRIIYSAMGMWIRAIASSSNIESQSISKNQFHRSIQKILDSFLIVNGKTARWFYPENQTNPTNILRDVLFNSGDIIECGFDSKITARTPITVKYNNTNLIRIGAANSFENIIVSGMAITENGCCDLNTVDLLEYFHIPLISHEEFLHFITKNLKWEKIANIDNYEFFDPNKNSVFSSCWTKFLPLKDNQIYISRSQLSYGAFNYKLCKQSNEVIFMASISSYSQNEHVRDTQRMQYIVKSFYGQCAKARADIGRDYSILHFWSKLPPAETKLLNYIGWPLENIGNRKNEFVIKNDFLEVIELLVNNLGINMEVNHL
ncbi:MAG: hypothetical protein MJ094_01240 [Saccharofermentans sp.]|nr:hypothetical protein [Saccharofermentans sp.]